MFVASPVAICETQEADRRRTWRLTKMVSRHTLVSIDRTSKYNTHKSTTALRWKDATFRYPRCLTSGCLQRADGPCLLLPHAAEISTSSSLILFRQIQRPRNTTRDQGKSGRAILPLSEIRPLPVSCIASTLPPLQQFQLLILDFAHAPTNVIQTAAGDSYVDCLVRFSEG